MAVSGEGVSNGTQSHLHIKQGNASALHIRGGNLTAQHGQASPAEMQRAMFVFYLVLLSMFGFQSILVYWRRKHQRSYDLVQLLGLWVVPASIALQFGFLRFLVAWLLYSAVTGYFLFVCTFGGRMDKAMPRRIYRWFFLVFKVSVAVGIVGYALLLVQIMGGGFVYAPVLGAEAALTCLWYGLYFGILSRDSAEIASSRIALMLGTGRKMAVSVRDCGICGAELTSGLPTPPSSSAAAAAAADGGNQTVQLSCKHLFHDECIRGWTIVGKKDTCPTCWEKVDLRSLYADRPWETSNLSWVQMLDMIRYLMVWNPVILVILHFGLHWTHLDEPLDHHHQASVNSSLLNSTIAMANSSLAMANSSLAMANSSLARQS